MLCVRVWCAFDGAELLTSGFSFSSVLLHLSVKRVTRAEYCTKKSSSALVRGPP